MGLYDHIKVGTRITVGSHTFDPEGIKKFAKKFDPQPFHLDEELAKESVFGGLCASGWHTLSVWMGLNIKNARPLWIEASGYDGPLPNFGPSPGVSNIKWLRPVMAGDTLTYHNEIQAKRPLKSRPEWGLVSSSTSANNQHGKLVLTMDGSFMIGLD